MIVFLINSEETRYAAPHPARSGKRADCWWVASKAKIKDVRNAREDPANMAAIPTRAEIRMSSVRKKTDPLSSAPEMDPMPPPIVNSGASVPPDVPLPSAIDQEISLAKQKKAKIVPDSEPSRMCSMLSYPTPRV